MPCPHYHQGPHRLVVRTSRRGRDNPGSTPGEDMPSGDLSGPDVLPEDNIPQAVVGRKVHFLTHVRVMDKVTRRELGADPPALGRSAVPFGGTVYSDSASGQ